MQRWYDFIADYNGKPLAGATVRLLNYPALTTATYFTTTDTSSPQIIPMTSGEDGSIAFYAADGHYQLSITGRNGRVTTIPDILIEDPANGSVALASVASTATYAINAGTSSYAGTSGYSGTSVHAGTSAYSTSAGSALTASTATVAPNYLSLSTASSSAGSALIGFLQAGTGAVAETVQKALRKFVYLSNYLPADYVTDGSVDYTTQFSAACLACATNGYLLRLDRGTFLIQNQTLPANFLGIVGDGVGISTLKFVRQAYADGAVMLYANGTGKPIVLQGFSIDVDDAVFDTAQSYAIAVTGVNDVICSNLKITGKGTAGLYLGTVTKAKVHNVEVVSTAVTLVSFTGTLSGTTLTVSGVTGTLAVGQTIGGSGVLYGNTITGGSGSSWTVVAGQTIGPIAMAVIRGLHTGIMVEGGNQVQVSKCKVTGYHDYGIVFSAGTTFSSIESSYTEESVAFGQSLGGANLCHISNSFNYNSGHEGFQITDCLYSSISNCTTEWDVYHGVDAGISMNGQSTNSCRLNKATGNTVVNSFAAGLLNASWSQGNMFESNILRDCAVRGEASGGVGAIMGQYTGVTNSVCTGNTFKGNKIYSESGTVTYGYQEVNNAGVTGCTLGNTNLIDNEFQGGGTITTRYLLNDYTTSRITDLQWVDYTPTVTVSTPGAFAYTINAAKYRMQGETIFVRWDITITDAGTATAPLVVSFPTNQGAATNSGIIAGVENGITAKMLKGIANSTGAIITLYDNSFTGVLNYRLVCEGQYSRV